MRGGCRRGAPLVRCAVQDAILRREGSLQAYADVIISDFQRTGETT